MIKRMTPAEYHAIGRGKDLREWAVSKSLLADFAASPYKWKDDRDKGKKKKITEEMEWGSAVDAMVTAPEEAERLIVTVDSDSWRGDASKKRAAIREAGQLPILACDMPGLYQARDNFLAHMETHGLDRWETQVAAFHSMEVDGQPFVIKALADLWNPETATLADVKTTNSLDEWDLRRTAKKFKYHWQAAMYIQAFRDHGHDVPDEFALHFIESNEPYRTRILMLTAEDIAQGREEYRAALCLWKTCLDLPPDREWPGKEMGIIYGLNR